MSSKTSILYLEDHEDTRDLIRLVLEYRNYDVATTATVASGLTLARSRHFDLYLLDSRLPDGSGLDFCRELRGFDSLTPILFYSAAASELDKQSALACGAQGYLTKPTSYEDLCALVKSLILDSHQMTLVTRA
ncbi:MAG TPA: response regulator [Pyrinomonadaceae bacterium]|nr:response regulator [Pyrinomonadaceae bacterium]